MDHEGTAPDGVTLGVEEEYLLLDAAGRPVPEADAVLADAALRPAVRADDDLQHELLRAQVEVATPVCTTLDEAAGHLRRLRSALAAAARGRGARLVASGAAPLPADDVEVSDGRRYRGLADLAPALVAEQLICGMHVHVGVADRDRAVDVVNRLRADLPVLTALSTNSPFWNGEDTGFASWRTVHWARWPVQGPPPFLVSAAHYDARLDALLATGAVRDRKQVYWDVRLSDHLPTVEVRSFDVQLGVDDAVALAGLLRGLVVTALRDGDAGRPALDPEPDVLAAAVWGAARTSVHGDLFDVRTGALRPGTDAVADLLDRARPALAGSGDETHVEALLHRLVTGGTGARRQRDHVAVHGIGALTGFLADQTAG